MLSFLNHQPDKQPPRIPPQLNNVKRTLMENHIRVDAFWQGMNWSVRNDHILIKALENIFTIATDSFDIYHAAKEQVDRVSQHLNFASQINYGKVQSKSWFYGKDCQEVIIEQSFDDAMYCLLNKHYTQWDCVRVVTHPFTSFDFQLANGKVRRSEESGLCVLKVDLALLYTQYKLWRLDKLRSEYADGTAKTIANFIHSYPIVKLLKTHTEQVWYNRIRHHCLGLPVVDLREDSRLFLVNPYTQLDALAAWLKDKLDKSQDNIHIWMCWIPGIYTKNLKAYLTQDRILETHQIRMPWLLGKLPFIGMMFQLAFELQVHSNTLYAREYMVNYRKYKGNQTFGTILGLPYKEMLKKIDDEVTCFAENL